MRRFGLLVVVMLCVGILSCGQKTGIRQRVLQLQQSYTTQEDTPLTFEPLPLESDHSIASMTQPEHGVLENHGGVYVYSPPVNFSGDEHIQFVLEDGRAGQMRFPSNRSTIRPSSTPIFSPHAKIKPRT